MTVEEKLRIEREYGLPEESLAPLLNTLVGEPLRELGDLQDRGVIDGRGAEVRELPPGIPSRTDGRGRATAEARSSPAGQRPHLGRFAA